MRKTVTSFFLAFALFAGLLSGCTPSNAVPSPNGAGLSGQLSEKPVKDREGNAITVPSNLERIISTAPSNTEILTALGVSDKLVAVDKYSADVEGIPEGLPKINFRDPDAEALVDLKPDIIIASGHNRKGDEDPFALLKDAGICVVYIPTSNSIEGIYGDIEFLAAITGTEEKGREIIGSYQAEVKKITEIRDRAKLEKKKKVYFEIAPAPNLSSFGKNTFLNEFLETVGAENIFSAQDGWLSPNAEAVVAANPDVILTNVSYLDNAAGEIKAREGWDSIDAVKNVQVFLIDSNPSSRPSQLSVMALKQIAKAVYPELYSNI